MFNHQQRSKENTHIYCTYSWKVSRISKENANGQTVTLWLVRSKIERSLEAYFFSTSWRHTHTQSLAVACMLCIRKACMSVELRSSGETVNRMFVPQILKTARRIATRSIRLSHCCNYTHLTTTILYKLRVYVCVYVILLIYLILIYIHIYARTERVVFTVTSAFTYNMYTLHCACVCVCVYAIYACVQCIRWKESIVSQNPAYNNIYSKNSIHLVAFLSVNVCIAFSHYSVLCVGGRQYAVQQSSRLFLFSEARSIKFFLYAHINHLVR